MAACWNTPSARITGTLNEPVGCLLSVCEAVLFARGGPRHQRLHLVGRGFRSNFPRRRRGARSKEVLALSAFANPTGMVVTRTRESINTACIAHHDQVDDAIKSVHTRFVEMEASVSATLRRETGEKLQATIEKIDVVIPSPIFGYPRIVLDRMTESDEQSLGNLR